MQNIIAWINEALASKDIVTGMNYYRVKAKEIKATDGRLTAAYPWPYDGEFLVPGVEFEKILRRMPTSPTITIDEQSVKLRCGKLSGTIQTLPLTEWDYPGVDDIKWLPLPSGLMQVLKTLRPFVSDNASQSWALCIALEAGWGYATNNIALAGAACPSVGAIKALLPVWAVDFILGRTEGLTQWAWSDSFVAFRWGNGAWMRSQLVVGQFPEKATSLVRDAVNEKTSQKITDEFRTAFRACAELAEDTVALYVDRIVSKFGKAEFDVGAICEVPPNSEFSLWGAKFLLPALEAADSWSPGVWPKPAPFKGPIVSGYVVGRKA